jgi:hypothetical protein
MSEGAEWIPSIKSRQPGTVKSQNTDSGTTDKIEGSDHGSEVGKAKYIGFDKGKQLQKRDHGIHLQP